MDSSEYEARTDLAAAHRLAVQHGLNEGVWNHISLLHLVQGGGWHQASDAKPVPLSPGEAKTFVEQRITEQVFASFSDDFSLEILSPSHFGSYASFLFQTCHSCPKEA